MPFEFIQPFDIFFRREDRHAIAFTGFGHDPTARFAIAVAAHADLVTGWVEPGVTGFTLIPEDPAWASTRALAVALWVAGDARRVTSTIVPR